MPKLYLIKVYCPICKKYYGLRSDQPTDRCRNPKCKAQVKLQQVDKFPWGHPVQYGKLLTRSPRYNPRYRWRRKPPAERYHPPQKRTEMSPAVTGEILGPEPVLLQPDPNGTPVGDYSVAPIKPAPASSNGAAWFWGLFSLAMLGLAISFLVKPALLLGFLGSIGSLIGGGGSGGSCAKLNSAIQSYHGCSTSHGGVTKSGYKWCEYTLKSAGSDWNLNGVNMAMGTYGEGWIPNACH